LLSVLYITNSSRSICGNVLCASVFHLTLKLEQS
jgi:hypothetical protein